MSTQLTLQYENYYCSFKKSFSEHAPSFNYRISMDTKVPITPSSQNKSYRHVIVDALGGFVVTVPITVTLDLLIISTVTVNLTMLKQQLGHFYITGLSNLVHP